MSAFIDFQGFQEPQGLFVVKELVIQPINSRSSPTIKIFKPPCEKSRLTEEYKKIVDNCEKNYHGISWEAGHDQYNNVSTIIIGELVGKFNYLFVKGEDRKKWLTFILRFNPMTIFNLEDLGCPDMKILETEHPAIRHMNSHPLCSSYKCAYENAQRYKYWYIKKFSTRANMKKSILHFCAVENITELTQKDIAALPVMAIIKFASHQIDEIWEKLSVEQRSNPTISKLKRCKKHPIQNDCEDEVGISYYVLEKDCLKCKEGTDNGELNFIIE